MYGCLEELIVERKSSDTILTYLEIRERQH